MDGGPPGDPDQVAVNGPRLRQRLRPRLRLVAPVAAFAVGYPVDHAAGSAFRPQEHDRYLCRTGDTEVVERHEEAHQIAADLAAPLALVSLGPAGDHRVRGIGTAAGLLDEGCREVEMKPIDGAGLGRGAQA